jgi:hypothetical protein
MEFLPVKILFDDPDSTDVVRNWLYYNHKKIFKGHLVLVSGLQNRESKCSRQSCVEFIWQRKYDDALNRLVDQQITSRSP